MWTNLFEAKKVVIIVCCLLCIVPKELVHVWTGFSCRGKETTATWSLQQTTRGTRFQLNCNNECYVLENAKHIICLKQICVNRRNKGTSNF